MAKIDQNLYFFYFAPIEYALVTSICCFYTDPIQGEKYKVIDEYQDPGGPTRGSQRSKNGKNWSLEELSWGPVWPFWAIQDPWIRTPRSSFSAITLYYSSCIRSVLLKCKFVYRKSRVGAKKNQKMFWSILDILGHSGPLNGYPQGSTLYSIILFYSTRIRSV